MTLTKLFELAASRHASDLHLATGEAPRLRIDGALVPLEGEPDLPLLLESLLTPEANARLAAGLPVERTLVHGDLAFNGILFRVGEGGLAATFRIVAKRVPPFAVIMEGAEAFFRRLAETPRGLVLIVGLTGSGKWTTACSLVDAINEAKAARIFVVTASLGYVFESKRGFVTQLSVGHDCDSYVRAMEIAHKADPDVIALDDVPTLETLREALVLAQTGHLVVANLHAATPVEALERLLDSAGPEEAALRRALADNLVAVTGQRLVPSADGTRRIAAYEWIANTPAVRAALLAGEDLARVQAEDEGQRTG